MLERLEEASNRVLRFNPCVMLHDLRLRMRSVTVYWLMLVFVILCSLAVAAPFAMWLAERASGSTPEDVATMGRHGITALAYALLSLMVLALPAWAGAGIAGERDRDTLAVLRSTRLSASDVAMGKFTATVFYAAMLLAVSLPLASWCMMLGSVSPGEVALLYAILLTFAIAVAGLGTWMSALCRSVISAVVSTYVGLIVVFGLPVLIGLLSHRIRGVAGIIFEDITLALVGMVPMAITAWTAAILVRWIVARAGHLQGDRAQAVLGVILFGISIIAMAALGEGAGVLGSFSGRDLAAVNPYLGLIYVIDAGRSAVGMLWMCLAIAAAGCMGATRCLRLREFHPVYVDDIFIATWERFRARRTASVES